MDLTILDMIGTISFALAGFIVSSKANYDILGITFITFISSFGGGVTRDILIGNIPSIFINSYSLIIVSIVILMAIVLKYHHNEDLKDNHLFVLADTIGLVTFSYTGAIKALESNLNIGGVLFLALISSIGGGLYRDIIMNKEAYILKQDFYGAIALIIGLLTYINHLIFTNNTINIIIILLIGIIIRYIAIYYKWHLPKIN